VGTYPGKHPDRYILMGKDPDDGEDPDRWFLLEWRDILMMGSPAVPSADAVPSTSWGFLKVLYLEP